MTEKKLNINVLSEIAEDSVITKEHVEVYQESFVQKCKIRVAT